MNPMRFHLKKYERSIDMSTPDKDANQMYFRHRISKEKASGYTKSMQSIDSNRFSVNIAQKSKKVNRRKLLSIPVSESKPVLT